MLVGSAADNFFRGEGGADDIHGGAGFDIIDYRTSGAGVVVDLAAGTATAVEGDDTFTSIANTVLPLIVGWNLGRHQLYLSPKVGWQRWWSRGAMPVDVPFAGAGVGFAWRLRKRTSLITEVTALHTPTSLDNSDGAGILNVGVGLVFDGR